MSRREGAKPTWMANRSSWPTAKKGANIPKDDATAKLITSITDLHVHHCVSERQILKHAGCVSAA